MRIALFIIFSLVISISVSAQKKLKFVIGENTGDTLWSTSDQKIYTKPGSPRSVGEYLKTTLYRKNSVYLLGLEIQTGRTSVFTIADGAAANIRLLDGNTVTLYSTGDHSSKVSKLDYGCFIFTFYKISSSDFRQLQSSPVSSIRVNASLGNMDYEIKEKFSNSIKEQLTWISQEP
jgi:hypothetical protein